jgi:hypothetical protein
MQSQLIPFTDPDGDQGYTLQGYIAETATYVMQDALMRRARWMDHQPPLVPGRGVPAFTMMTMRTMRALGVPAGGLRRLVVWGNHHVESVLQLAARERDGHPLDAAVVETTSYLSIETPMIQSGHQITSVHVHGGRREPIANLLRWHERRVTAFEHVPPDRTEEHAAVLAKMKRSVDDIVLFDYELHIELAPS